MRDELIAASRNSGDAWKLLTEGYDQANIPSDEGTFTIHMFISVEEH